MVRPRSGPGSHPSPRRRVGRRGTVLRRRPARSRPPRGRPRTRRPRTTRPRAPAVRAVRDRSQTRRRSVPEASRRSIKEGSAVPRPTARTAATSRRTSARGNPPADTSTTRMSPSRVAVVVRSRTVPVSSLVRLWKSCSPRAVRARRGRGRRRRRGRDRSLRREQARVQVVAVGPSDRVVGGVESGRYVGGRPYPHRAGEVPVERFAA